MAHHEHTFALGERPKTLDDMVEWLKAGKAEIWVHHSGVPWLSWGVGSDHNYVLTRREYTLIQRRVTLVESAYSVRENKRRTSLKGREYAAAGHQTWRDAHGW